MKKLKRKIVKKCKKQKVKFRLKNPLDSSGNEYSSIDINFIQILVQAILHGHSDSISDALNYKAIGNFCNDCGKFYESCDCEYCEDCGKNRCIEKYISVSEKNIKKTLDQLMHPWDKLTEDKNNVRKAAMEIAFENLNIIQLKGMWIELDNEFKKYYNKKNVEVCTRLAKSKKEIEEYLKNIDYDD